MIGVIQSVFWQNLNKYLDSLAVKNPYCTACRLFRGKTKIFLGRLIYAFRLMLRLPFDEGATRDGVRLSERGDLPSITECLNKLRQDTCNFFYIITANPSVRR